MDLDAFASPVAIIASVSVGAIVAAGAATFLPRIAMATVRWARSLIGGDDGWWEVDSDGEWVRVRDHD